jgi:C-terminal processing protease CtpA/Prc
LAILQQTVFSPFQGFNLQTDMINTFIANSVLAYGKIVEPAASTGILSLGDEYGYFLMEEVTSDGPSQLEIELGWQQYEKKAGDSVAVSVLIPKRGAVVRTKWVSVGDGGVSVANDVTLNISGGVYVTGASAAAGTKGKLKKIETDSLSNTLYYVEIL